MVGLGGSLGGGGRGAAALIFTDYDPVGLYIIGGGSWRQHSNRLLLGIVLKRRVVEKSENGVSRGYLSQTAQQGN